MDNDELGKYKPTVRTVRLKILKTGNFTLGHLMHLLTVKIELSRDRYFNVNAAKLVMRTALNEFQKRLQQEKTDTSNGLIFTQIILIY
jgi:hypothetical protein